MSRFGRGLALTVATAFLMEGVDSSAVTTALPAMAHDLGTSVEHLSATITSYLISVAVLMPFGGWLADRFGGRLVFVAAVATFSMGSLLCGLAPNSLVLIFGRIVQGGGGAMMVPVGRAMLMSHVDKSDYLRAMNYVIIPALIGPAAGPLLGGFLSTYASWHWIFLINLPLGALGIFMALRFMPSGLADPDAPANRLDWVGYGFLMVALGVGQATIELTAHHGPPRVGIGCGVLAIGAGLLFVRRYRQIGSGVLDLGLLRIRTLRLSITAGSIARAGLGGVPFVLPLLLQVVFGYSPFQSGSVTFLVAIGSAVMKPVMGFSLRRLGCRRLLLVNSVFTAAGLVGFLVFRTQASLVFLMPYVFIFGLMRSVQMSTMNALSYTDVAKRDMARAATLSTLAQRLSMGLGVNVAAIVLGIAGNGMLDITAFAWSFVASAVLVVAAGAMFFGLHPDDGWQVSNRAPAGDLGARQTAAELGAGQA